MATSFANQEQVEDLSQNIAWSMHINAHVFRSRIFFETNAIQTMDAVSRLICRRLIYYLKSVDVAKMCIDRVRIFIRTLFKAK